VIEPGAREDGAGVAQDALLGCDLAGRQIAFARPAGRALAYQLELADITVDAAGAGGHNDSFLTVPIQKWPICSISLLREKFYPRNINHMTAVKFFERLDLDQIFLFLDGH
jgi:hypothetical protein